MTSMAADEAPTATAAVASAGAALRSARESRGLHIAALAAMLKVPQAKLEALEADRYQDLPDATFARALARAVCRVLKVEAEPVLALLPRGSEATLDRVSPGLNQPFRERALSQDGLSLDILKSPVVLAVAGLLLAALLVYVLPAQWIEGVSQRLSSAESTNVVAAVPGDAASAVELAPVAQPESVAASGAVSPQALAPSAAVVATSTAGPVAPTLPPAASTPTPVAAPAVGGVPLQVKVSSESWIEVVDAQGQVLLSRLLRPGEQASLSGQAPLKLRIGNVAGTELVFRGQPVDLASRSRDNVARLELN